MDAIVREAFEGTIACAGITTEGPGKGLRPGFKFQKLHYPFQRLVSRRCQVYFKRGESDNGQGGRIGTCQKCSLDYSEAVERSAMKEEGDEDMMELEEEEEEEEEEQVQDESDEVRGLNSLNAIDCHYTGWDRNNAT